MGTAFHILRWILGVGCLWGALMSVAIAFCITAAQSDAEAERLHRELFNG